MNRLYQIFRHHPAVSTDSRNIRPDSIFFALKGANFDGNQFALEALRKGAAYAVIDDPKILAQIRKKYEAEEQAKAENKATTQDKQHTPTKKADNAPQADSFRGKTAEEKEMLQGIVDEIHAIEEHINRTYAEEIWQEEQHIILVDDCLKALQELAQAHRRALDIPILAISGSNGKTTTKELINRVLRCHFKTYATQGNLNNHIGVPLTLLAMTRKTQFGIVEMGASSCGEIALLASIAQPDYGILTNVGRAHLEGFGGEEGVRRGKGELYDFLMQHSGKAFLREDDETLCQMAKERPALDTIPYSTQLSEGIESHLEGDYNRFNIAAAVAVGREFGISDREIRAAIADYTPENNRSQRQTTDRNTLIIDCYNANPSSMRASIENFQNETASDRLQHVYILGDMLELGAWATEEHRTIIELVAKDTEAVILLVGREFQEAYSSLENQPEHCHLFPTRTELAAYLDQHPLSNDLILIKGSRGIGLEKIIERL